MNFRCGLFLVILGSQGESVGKLWKCFTSCQETIYSVWFPLFFLRSKIRIEELSNFPCLITWIWYFELYLNRLSWFSSFYLQNLNIDSYFVCITETSCPSFSAWSASHWICTWRLGNSIYTKCFCFAVFHVLQFLSCKGHYFILKFL